MMPPFDDYCQDGDVSRIHAWYASGLSEVFRTKLLHFFTALIAYSRTSVIVKPFWNFDFLVFFRPLRCFFLLFDIRLIMTHNIYLFFQSICVVKMFSI